MAMYSKNAGEKVEETMDKMHEEIRQSGTGKKLTPRQQSLAMGLSEEKKACPKMPEKKSGRKSTKTTAGGSRSGPAKNGKRTISRSGDKKSVSKKPMI